MKAEARRPAPLGVKLEVALAQLETAMRKLGMIPVECETVKWELDHDPALGLRAIDEATGHHKPHQHAVRFLVWRPSAEHALKTTGRRGTSDLSLRDGDQSKIAKMDRIVEKSAEFNSRLLTKTTSNSIEPKLKSKSQIKSRVRPKAKPQRRASSFKRKGV